MRRTEIVPLMRKHTSQMAQTSKGKDLDAQSELRLNENIFNDESALVLHQDEDLLLENKKT